MYHALFVDTDTAELNVKLNEGYTIQNDYTVGGRTMFILRNRDLDRRNELTRGTPPEQELDLTTATIASPGLQWQYTAPPRG